jgi:glycerate kinase
VVAVESWPGVEGEASLTAGEAAAVIDRAWREVAPGVEVVAIPVASGGPRTADALAGSRSRAGGAEVVEGPGGLWLAPALSALRWNPMDLSAALLGLAAAGEKRTVHIPLGDEPPAGDALDLWGGHLEAVRKALASLPVIALAGSMRPLVGFHGMSSTLRDGRESDAAIAAAAQEQERRWTGIALHGDAIAGAASLLGPSRLSDAPGAGAAGGLAYCLAVLGARLVPASAYVVEAWGVRAAAEGADVLVAVTADLTPRTLDHGIATPVAAEAGRRAVPATALAPSVQVGKRDLMAAGLASAHEAGPGEQGLADGIRRLAHTWTPHRA